MLSEGRDAPAVALPGYVDGERRRVDLDEYLGEGVVVLAFYPADFNPGCSAQEADIGDLDLFAMQKDVDVFAVSPDSTYSHGAFADRYSLTVPLLSDSDGEAADAYDVALEAEGGESLCERAVFVVDHHGVVQYAWATADLEERVDVDPVKRAVQAVGGDERAIKQYRAGYERYVAGHEAFTEAMSAYEEREWLDARESFENAESAFAAATDRFDTAVRFAETDDFETVADRAEEKSDTLTRAVNWLAESADALGNGRGTQGTEYRDDAERLLSAASDVPEPPETDAFTLTETGITLDDGIVGDLDEDRMAGASRSGDGTVEVELTIDDAALDAAAEGDDRADTIEGDTVEGDLEMDLDVIEETDGDENEDSETSTVEDGGPTATDEADADKDGGADANADGDGDGDSGEEETTVETLDLADPTESEADEDEDDDRTDWNIPGQ